MKRLRPLAATFLIALAACGAPALPASQNYATLQGRVLDAATNAPIPGAVVTVNFVSNSAPTGPDGSFKVQNVPIVQDDYSAAAPGYAGSVTASTSFAPGQTVTVTITLQKSS